MTDTISIYTDGSCAGNPGPGGFAAIMEIPGEPEMTVTGGEPHSTNNRMELSAVIEALAVVAETPRLQQQPLAVYTDSQYVCRAFQENWFRNWTRNGWRTSKGDPVANTPLWQRLRSLAQDRDISWHWIKGHSGHPQNERCDRMAAACARKAPGRQGYWAEPSQETPATRQPETAPEPRPAPEPGPVPAPTAPEPEPPRCQVCGQPATPENSFPLQPNALLHAVDEDTRGQLNDQWDREGLPEEMVSHTRCISSPHLLDWPRHTAYQAWATSRIAELESRLAALEGR